MTALWVLGAASLWTEARAQVAAPAPLSSSALHAAFAPAGAVSLPPTDAYTDRYRNPDGTITAVISAQPVRRRTLQGWQDLTGAMSPSTVPGYAAQAQGKATVLLGGLSAETLNTVSRNGRSVSFAFMGSASAAGIPEAVSSAGGVIAANGRTMQFTEAFPGVDVALTSIPEGGIKESILVKSRQAAPWNGEWSYALRLQGLDARPITNAAGSHILLSESDTGIASPVMEIAPPYAVDARGVRTDNCWWILADDHRSLTLVVDPNYLADPARVYPVMIDPTVNVKPDATNGMDTYIRPGLMTQDANYGTSPEIDLGNYLTDQSGDNQAGYLRFNLGGLPAPMGGIPETATITEAKLWVYVKAFTPGTSTCPIAAAQVNGPWDEAALTFNRAVSLPAATPIGSAVTATALGWVAFPATATVTAWFTGAARNFGFRLQRDAGTGSGGCQLYSSDEATRVALRPVIIVTYSLGDQSSTSQYYDLGAPEPWQSGTALNPYQTLNLVNGNVLTTLPITGWQGFGPGIDFTLFHNSRQRMGWGSPISERWTHSYWQMLKFTGTGDPKPHVYYKGPDDNYYHYSTPVDPNHTEIYTYTRPTGIYSELTYVKAEGKYLLTTPDQTVYRFDTSGKLLSVRDANVQDVNNPSLDPTNEVTLTYNGSGQLTTITDANPDSGKRRSLTLGYNGSGHISTITDPLGRVWTLVYDPTYGDLTQVKLPRRWDGTTDSLEYGYWFQYNTVNNVDPNTGYQYGHLITAIGEPNDNPTSNPTPTWNYSTEYDAFARGTTSLGRSGLGVRGMHGIYVNYADTSISPAWTKIVDQTEVTRQVYFASGKIDHVVKVTNPTDPDANWVGPMTSYSWDSGNNLIGIRMPFDQSQGSDYWTISYFYDQPTAPGEVTKQVTHVRNANGTSDPDRVITYAYDTNSHHRLTLMNERFQTTPAVREHATRYTYDNDPVSGWRQLTKKETAEANTNWVFERVTQYTYAQPSDDPYWPGRVKSMTDENNHVWSYHYDAYGNLDQLTSPSPTNRVTHWSYITTTPPNPGMLLASKTDPANQVFTTTYHTLGTNPDWRAQSVSVGGLTNSYRWSPNGERLYADNYISGGGAAQPVSWTYTDGGLVTQEIQSVHTVNYTYDPMGRRASMSYPVYWPYAHTSVINTISYVYNNLGQLSTQTWAPAASNLTPQTFSYTYDNTACSCGTGRLQQETFPNHAYTTFTYNNLGEETERAHMSSTGSNLGTYDMARQGDGLITSINFTTASHSTDYYRTMAYNNWGEMLDEKFDPQSDSYWHDVYTVGSIGRTTHTQYYFNAQQQTEVPQYEDDYLYDQGNQMTQITHWGWNGYWTSRTESLAGVFDLNGNQLRPSGTFLWNSPAALSYYPDNRLKSDNGGSSLFQYDGAGRYFSNQLDGNHITYDGSTPIVEDYPSQLTQSTERVYGLDGHFEVNYTMWSYTPPFISTVYQYDPQGGYGVMSDPSTGTTGSAMWPQSTYGTGLTGYGSGELNWLGGLGYRYQSTANIFAVGYRAYDPTAGRFLQQDPLSFGAGDYTYANSSPANFVDPTGLVNQKQPWWYTHKKITGPTHILAWELRHYYSKFLTDCMARLRKAVSGDPEVIPYDVGHTVIANNKRQIYGCVNAEGYALLGIPNIVYDTFGVTLQEWSWKTL